MRKNSKSIIAEIKRNRRLMGTCPVCNEDFRLTDAALFALDDEPTERALAAVQTMRQRIQERKLELADARERMTERARKTAQAVNLGKIIEKIAPSFPTFSYWPGDCRALFEPIDYLIFPGLVRRNRVDALIFVDVKSGRARLTNVQKSIKDKVESGKVKFNTTRS